jgi:hypothetical protein
MGSLSKRDRPDDFSGVETPFEPSESAAVTFARVPSAALPEGVPLRHTRANGRVMYFTLERVSCDDEPETDLGHRR